MSYDIYFIKRKDLTSNNIETILESDVSKSDQHFVSKQLMLEIKDKLIQQGLKFEVFEKTDENYLELNFPTYQVSMFNSQFAISVPYCNIGLAIWRLKCFYETFVQGSTAVILLNFCAKNPPHRQAENRCEKQSNGEYHVKQVTQTTYLRGLQRTDENGWVFFDTIVPCWYIGRIPHIHFKVFVNNKECINSQLYFEKNYCDNLFTTKEPYTKMGKCPMDFPNDAVFAMAGGKHQGLLLLPHLTNDNKLSAIAKIGVMKI
jgi:hypothetical protein